jgi:2-hydroxychromene-2-carboxylate isomerase
VSNQPHHTSRQEEHSVSNADIEFYFDPVCPFCWMTSKWVRTVAAQREFTVDWRFISLRLINAEIDYDTHFPAGYETGHTAGLQLLRLAARARAEHGPEVIDRLYAAMGTAVFETDTEAQQRLHRDSHRFVAPVLTQAGLPAGLADALEDTSWDAQIQAETDQALALTGRDVGTPIIHFQPPTGVAFFGPVISRQPSDADAVPLWDHVVGLARFPGFAELKRSLRETPQLPALGISDGQVGIEEDWHAGHRRHAG